jgi:hypothetical protein
MRLYIPPSILFPAGFDARKARQTVQQFRKNTAYRSDVRKGFSQGTLNFMTLRHKRPWAETSGELGLLLLALALTIVIASLS